MPTFEFSKVVIIESLAAQDRKSGSELCAFIDGLSAVCSGIPSAQLIDVPDARAFVAAINALTNRADSDGEVPILQIETHGWSDKTGLAFSDNSSITWHELGTLLSDLNRATGFNLVVCVAACFGGYFIEALRPTQPSPCFAMIGPTDTMGPDEIFDSFCSFYEAILRIRDARAALEALHKHQIKAGGFITISAEDWFFKLATGYLTENCTPERLKERSATIIEAVSLECPQLNETQREHIARLGEELAYSFLDRRFPSFFMTDAVPENRQRFARSLEIAKARTREFLAAPP